MLNKGAILPGIWLVSAIFFLGALFAGWWVFFVGVPLFFFFLILLLRKTVKKIWWKVFIPVLLFSLVGVYAEHSLPRGLDEVIPPGTNCTLVGVVRTLDLAFPNRLLLYAREVIVAGQRIAFPYRVWVINKGKGVWEDDLVGQRVSLPVRYIGKGRFAFYPQPYSRQPVLIGKPYKIAFLIRKGLYYMLRKFKGRIGSLVLGSVLGVKTDGFYKLRAELASIGVSHILAISGLHLLILTSFVFWFPRLLNISEWLVDVLSLLFVWGYVFMIPESPSLLRAGIMFSLFLISRLIQRNWSIYDMLGLTIFVIFFVDPMQFFSLGFWFSVISVLSILIGFSLLPHHSILDPWYLSIVVSLGIGPLIVKYFNCYPLVSWLLNPIVIFMLAVMLLLVMVYLLTFGILGAKGIMLIAKGILVLPSLFKDRTLPICLTLSTRGILVYYLALLTILALIGLFTIRENKYERWM